ncbi:hypothetical protein VNO77_22571 [Canavalia gladiata]|uniref:Uncharacterized protein n=1 Tax=Canavalia gladiata TaxID=3824 RepID=A0AAN9L6A3_CANGL
MRNSKGRSMKHSQLFHYQDQRSEGHKKIVRDRAESNNSFMTREIPIQRLFNVGHFANGSGDLSRFSKGKNFSSGINVMDYDIPELVVFIQEDHQQFVKDICIDKRVSPEGKCVSQGWELFEPNRRDSNLRTMEAMSINSNGSGHCASKHLSLKDAMELYDGRSLMMHGEVGLDSGYKVSSDHPLKKTTPDTLREVLRKEAEFSPSFKNWQINSYLGTVGSRVEFPHCAGCLQVTDTSMSRPEMGNSKSLTESSKRQLDFPQEICSCSVNPLSGSTSYAAPGTTSSSASHHSNDSISSTHSFAFPILPVEWNGSPVRMLEADKSQLRKHRWQKIWIYFSCCK